MRALASCGSLRVNRRVINVERTNLAKLDRQLIPEPAELVTIDLSYLAVADAIGQIDRRLLVPGAQRRIRPVIPGGFEEVQVRLTASGVPRSSGATTF
jgi:predicted rRNA methylase YqxC with S4 and FtsJ domains